MESSVFIAAVRAFGAAFSASLRSDDLLPNRFSELAEAALREQDFARVFEPDPTLLALLRMQSLSPELRSLIQPEDLIVELYRDEHFSIDIALWSRHTVVHSHANYGALQVLHGNSLHVEYTSPVAPDGIVAVMRGRLQRVEVRYLQAGDLLPIIARPSYFHQVWHLDQPTLSLRIRRKSPAHCAYIYFYPEVLLRSPFYELDEQRKALIPAVVGMFQAKHPGAAGRLWDIVATWPSHCSLYLLLRLAEAAVAPQILGEALQRLTTQIQAPDMADAMRASGDVLRQSRLPWHLISGCSERLCLALLLSGIHPEGGVHEILGDLPPAQRVLEPLACIASLAEAKMLPFALSPQALAVLKTLNNTDNARDALTKILRDYDAADLPTMHSDLREFVLELAEQPLLRVLVPTYVRNL